MSNGGDRSECSVNLFTVGLHFYRYNSEATNFVRGFLLTEYSDFFDIL